MAQILTDYADISEIIQQNSGYHNFLRSSNNTEMSVVIINKSSNMLILIYISLFKYFVIIGTEVYLFGISAFSFTDLCCTYYDPGYTTKIAILDFENGQYEIKHKMKHGEISYAAIPFGCRYVALFPERYHYIDITTSLFYKLCPLIINKKLHDPCTHN